MRAPPQMIPPSNPSLLPSQSTIFQEGLKSEVGVYGFFFPAQFVPRKKRSLLLPGKYICGIDIVSSFLREGVN